MFCFNVHTCSYGSGSSVCWISFGLFEEDSSLCGGEAAVKKDSVQRRAGLCAALSVLKSRCGF